MDALLSQYPRAEKTLKYGTAGFRDRADLPLNPTFVRMGILAAIRSRSCGGKAVGVMITASHNAEPDNGLKLVDVDGGMLSQAWEPLCEAVANAKTTEETVQILSDLRKEHCSTESSSNAVPIVLVGRDTRPHSMELMACVKMGVEAGGGRALDIGEVTTPLLHFAVASANDGTCSLNIDSDFDSESVHRHYYKTLAGGFIGLCSTVTSTTASKFSVVLDASFGVGSLSALAMSKELEDTASGLLTMDIRNAARTGPVNEGCGAEKVQKEVVPPCGVSSETDAGKTLVSFDGDADRVVFHTFPTAGSTDWKLLDGDKIACLFAVCLLEELQAAQLSATDVRLGCVQTAYANGASSDYLRSQNVPIVIAKTGVKFVHHKALQFDIGVYFEANGHGTVIFSPDYLKKLADLKPCPDGPDEERRWLAIRRLRFFVQAINSAVGDALSDMMVALACLSLRGWSLNHWVNIYTDYPSRQLKVKSANKSAITCSEDETTSLTPTILPVRLKEAADSAPRGRCFVRPSGTEDVVRVYAEAEDRASADELADKCVLAIKEALNEEV
jgi:phosphoacetylglucosamine mutase